MSDEFDATEDITFAAVGLALTRWETVEISLADLYSIFRGRPFARDTVLEFGQLYSTSSRRIAGLEMAAPAYFFHLSDQQREGEFTSLMQAVQAQLPNRHRIAHGLVDRVCFQGWDSVTSGYALVSPWYAERRLKMSPNDAWGARAITAASDEFVSLSGQVLAFVNQLIRDRS